MHSFLTLRSQSVDPATSATQCALYAKTVNSVPELFFRPNNSQTPIQMTYPTIKSDLSDTQYSFIAGPMIVYAGKITNPTNPQNVVLSPGSQLLFVDLVVSLVDEKNAIPTSLYEAAAINMSGTSFDIKYQTVITPSSINVYYFAVGLV